MQWAIGTCYNLGVSPDNYADFKQLIQKDYIMYDLVYITFLKWQSYRKPVQFRGC